MGQPRWALVALVAIASVAACVGDIGDGPEAPIGQHDSPVCEGAPPNAGRTPLRRLSRIEYNNAVRDLLGDTSRPADAFIADEMVAGFASNTYALIDKTGLEDYFYAAESIAKSAVAQRREVITSCDLSDTACVHRDLAALARRAFRQPLDEDTKRELFALYDSSASDWNPRTALELVITSVLLSPHFLYHVELTPAEAGQLPALLSNYELAARLSFFLWSSVPDDELLAAAERGQLHDRLFLATQVERMLAHENARDTIASFGAQWLGLEGGHSLSSAYKDPAVFPQWDPDLAAAMRTETDTFFNHVVMGGDHALATLLLADYSFINSDLAELYGVSPNSTDFSKTSLPDDRAGVLTQASLLTAKAHARAISWVLRGKFVRERLLCEPVAGPPNNVDMNQPNDPDRLKDPHCKSCHLLMDPIGRTFDAFDALGRSRDVDDNGDPINLDGTIENAGQTDVTGGYRGVRELAEKLAASDQVAACFAREWFRFANHRQESADDACSIQQVQQRFAETGNIRDLILDIALSDAFRYHHTGDTP